MLSLLVSLLHGHEGREVRLVVGENQRRAVAPVGRHLQGQVNPPERDGCEGCGDKQGRGRVELEGRGGPRSSQALWGWGELQLPICQAGEQWPPPGWAVVSAEGEACAKGLWKRALGAALPALSAPALPADCSLCLPFFSLTQEPEPGGRGGRCRGPWDQARTSWTGAGCLPLWGRTRGAGAPGV